MNRLIATFGLDLRVQMRNGFYIASAFIVALFVILLRQLPMEDGGAVGIVPAFLAVNLVVTTFYFIAALVLLEKAEGVLSGLVVSPLRPAEYLASKALTLTALGIVESVLIVVLGLGVGFNPLWLVVGATALGLLYAFAGFVMVSRYEAINDFILPSGLVIMFLFLPALDVVKLVETPLFLLHPARPMLALMQAAVMPVDAPMLLYGVVGSAVWVGVAYVLARRAFRAIVSRAG